MDGCSTIHSAVKENKGQALLFQRSRVVKNPDSLKHQIPGGCLYQMQPELRVPFHEIAHIRKTRDSNRPSQNTQNPLFYGERGISCEQEENSTLGRSVAVLRFSSRHLSVGFRMHHYLTILSH